MAKQKSAFDKIGASLDRFQEAHFWIHTLEQYYHHADPFRWHLNAFLRSLKEIPQLLSMELQKEKDFPKWFRNHKASLQADALIPVLSRQRDFVVHRGMLVPKSHAFLGITEGRGLKFGLTFPIHPLEDSDSGMDRYLRHAKKNGDFLGVLMPDEDSLPCIQREWKLPDFEDEIIDLCARAWLRIGQTIAEVLKWLGTEVPSLSLDCRHSSQQVQFKLYDRDKLSERMKTIK